MGLGVGELFYLFDLQTAVFICNDLRDDDRFAGHLRPKCGFRLGGDLKESRRQVNGCGTNLKFWTTNVNDDLARSLRDGMEGRLQEKVS